MIFDIANHLINGTSYLDQLNPEETSKVATILFKAAQKAQTSLAFSIGGSYFKTVVKLIDVRIDIYLFFNIYMFPF